MNDEDSDFITCSGDTGVGDDENLLRATEDFKDTFICQQTKSFLWLFEQNNLHNLFNLPEDCEEKLHKLFNIENFINENKPEKPNVDISLMEEFERNQEKHNILDNYFREYTKFTKLLAETPEYKNFLTLMNIISKEIENCNDISELFSKDNMKILENSLKNEKSVDFNEFIKVLRKEKRINELSKTTVCIEKNLINEEEEVSSNVSFGDI